MKKFLVLFIALFVFTISVPLGADAQTCRYRNNYSSRRYNRNVSRYNNVRYDNRSGYGNRYNNRYGNYNNGYGYNNGYQNYSSRSNRYDRPNFYRRHRNVINLGIGTGGGAILGGIIGGRRGAGVGALIGAGGGALYTYVLNKKRPRYYRR